MFNSFEPGTKLFVMCEIQVPDFSKEYIEELMGKEKLKVLDSF